MDTRKFWLAAALIGVTIALGCNGGPEQSGQTGAGQDRTATRGDAGAPSAAPQGERAPVSFDAPPPVGTRARCPVMGDDFTVTEDTPRSEYQGRHYVFCCPACKPQFDANPQRYLAPQASR
jgi:YHS domain-containing protein